MDTGWSGPQRAELLVILLCFTGLTTTLFSSSVNNEYRKTTHKFLKHTVAKRLKVTVYFEGRGGEETLYIENLNRFQKSGFTKQFTVFSPVGNVSLVS